MLSNSGSYAESKRLVELLKDSKYITSKNAAAMKEAIGNNSQVSRSWGVPELINKIAKQFES